MENMEKHVDNKKWKQWNLEATAKLLEKRFPNSFIWVVRPSRFHLSTFACYQNFVEVNMFGVPDHRNHSYGALKHLSSVIESAVKRSKWKVICFSQSLSSPLYKLCFSSLASSNRFLDAEVMFSDQ